MGTTTEVICKSSSYGVVWDKSVSCSNVRTHLNDTPTGSSLMDKLFDLNSEGKITDLHCSEIYERVNGGGSCSGDNNPISDRYSGFAYYELASDICSDGLEWDS